MTVLRVWQQQDSFPTLEIRVSGPGFQPFSEARVLKLRFRPLSNPSPFSGGAKVISRHNGFDMLRADPSWQQQQDHDACAKGYTQKGARLMWMVEC